MADVFQTPPLTVALPLPTHAQSPIAANYGLAALGVLPITLACAMLSPSCRHWFVLPVALCGILTGADVVAWLRRQVDTFDPKAIVGLLWFHATFVAPLIHVSLNAHAEYFNSQIYDWPKWFGLMGLLTAAGLVLYKAAQRYFFTRSRATATVYLFNEKSFMVILAGATIVSAIAALVIYLKFGGLHRESEIRLSGGEGIAHLSWLMMLGDPFPLLVAVYLVKSLAVSGRNRSLITVSILLGGLMVAHATMLGLRGSRSAILAVLFMVTALCHYRLRRIPITWLLVGVFGLSIAGYYYAFFKRFGSEALDAVTSTEIRKTLAERSGITPLGVLLGDLSRAEIQTFLLYRLTMHRDDYQLRRGQTYLFAGLTLIPRAVWPTKPSAIYGKVAAGTDLQYGEGTYRSGVRKSSRVYGPAGEAMLNFGVLGVLPAYVIFGSLLGWYRRKITTLHPQDARLYLVPVFTMVAFLAAFGDANNTMFALLKNGGLLILVIWASAYRSTTAAPNATASS